MPMPDQSTPPLLVRMTTVPASMQVLLKGQPAFMQSQGFRVQLISAYGKEVAALKEQENCPHQVVPFTRAITPIQDLKCLMQLIRLIKKWKPDIVHTHTPKAGLLGMLAARICGVPVKLHTIAGLPWMETTGIKRRLLKSMEQLTVFAADRVYPNSVELFQFLQAEGIGQAKMKVLGNGSSNGISLQYFQRSAEVMDSAGKLRREMQVKPEAWVWIFVGRLVKDKGLAELVQAFEELQHQFPTDQLWLLGVPEPELDPLDESTLQSLNNNPAIKQWGFVQDIRPHLAAAKALVFPSYREGFPNVPMQAGAMGCTLLLSNINGCNEIVSHNNNGLLFPVKDAQAVLSAMEKVRTDETLQQQLSSAIRPSIADRYDQQKIWQLILTEYQNLLAEKK